MSFAQQPGVEIPIIFVLKKTDKNLVSRRYGKLKLDFIDIEKKYEIQSSTSQWDICQHKNLLMILQTNEPNILVMNYITKEIENYN